MSRIHHEVRVMVILGRERLWVRKSFEASVAFDVLAKLSEADVANILSGYMSI